jgi:3-hydroxyisobutyrate dehydrogenase-like beta-hydroxyacid dehydrogenase
MKILFIGLGKMGLPMAMHLKSAGHVLVGFDTELKRREFANDAGIPTVESWQDVDERTDVVISSLPNDEALKAVAQQVTTKSFNNSITFIDTSTVSVNASQMVAKSLAKTPHNYLRASVSGNTLMAQQANLTVLVSGLPDIYNKMLPLLRTWGIQHIYLGSNEQARIAKLAINLMVAQTVVALGEASALATRGGIEWSDFWKLISSSAVASPIVLAKAKPLSLHDYSPTFTVDQMRKDLGLILKAAAEYDLDAPMTYVAAQQIDTASAQGLGLEDYASVIKLNFKHTSKL